MIKIQINRNQSPENGAPQIYKQLRQMSVRNNKVDREHFAEQDMKDVNKQRVFSQKPERTARPTLFYID